MDITNTLAKLRIEELNAMQEAALAAILHTDRDVVVLAPTGSGKTLAYLLPIATRLDAKLDEVQAVVIVPSRELALQSCEVFRSMGTGLRPIALYGGRATMDEHREVMRLRPQIVFATPGRLNDHIAKQNFAVDHVHWLVLDEFDKCLRMGFRADFLDRDEQTPDRISLFTVKSPEKDKLQTLLQMLLEFGDQQSIVFLNYRDGVERVAKFLAAEGFVISALHGGLDQRQREEAVYRFANHSANVLVGTDLAARGLDIPDVANIIHYNLPVGADEYVHRIGRTGRWDATGRSFIILGPEEHLPEYVKEQTAEYAPQSKKGAAPQPRMATLYVGKGKKDKVSKGDILGFLCKTCALEGAQIGKIDVYERYAYVAVSRSVAKQVVKMAQNTKIKGVRTKVEFAF